jgi:RES domain-containing protein
MKLYRLVRKQYARALDGVGAKLYPGRWNSLDVPMIYCAASIEQWVLAVLVHLEEPPADYVLVELTLPDDVPILEIKPRELPRQWKSPVYNAATRAVGDRFIESEVMVFKVPSAVTPGAFNYLLNPSHPLIGQVKIRLKPFKFDQRLFKRK